MNEGENKQVRIQAFVRDKKGTTDIDYSFLGIFFLKTTPLVDMFIELNFRTDAAIKERKYLSWTSTTTNATDASIVSF